MLWFSSESLWERSCGLQYFVWFWLSPSLLLQFLSSANQFSMLERYQLECREFLQYLDAQQALPLGLRFSAWSLTIYYQLIQIICTSYLVFERHVKVLLMFKQQSVHLCILRLDGVRSWYYSHFWTCSLIKSLLLLCRWSLNALLLFACPNH